MDAVRGSCGKRSLRLEGVCSWCARCVCSSRVLMRYPTLSGSANSMRWIVVLVCLTVQRMREVSQRQARVERESGGLRAARFRRVHASDNRP